MAISLWEMRSDMKLKGAASSTEEITGSSVKNLLKRKSEH